MDTIEISETDLREVIYDAVLAAASGDTSKMGTYYEKLVAKYSDDTIVPDSKATAQTLAALRATAPQLEALTDSEILGVRALILATMSRHAYLGEGGPCLMCGQMLDNKEVHYESVTVTLEVEEMTLTAAAGEATRWQATLLAEGAPTEDGRLILPGAVTWRALPIPLGLMLETPHSDLSTAPVCGRIDQIWRAGNLIQASGVFSDTADDPELASVGKQAVEAVANRFVTGVSVDLMVLDDETQFVPRENDVEDDSGDGAGQEDGGMDIVVIDDGDGDIDLPGVPDLDDGTWLYVVKEAVIGASCIVPVPAIAQGQIQVLTASGAFTWIRVTTALFQEEEALFASVAPVAPPTAWFTEPEPDEPTALTITEDGKVFGHAALWESCHVGFPGRCVPPPMSQSGYSMFHVGAIRTAEGETLPCGKITMKAPHADVSLNSTAARSHYDHTGSVVAFVRASNGKHGVWLSGVLKSDASEESVRDLLANPISGDWRNGEMIAAHAVPVPGFPVLRASAFNDDGDEVDTALIITSPIPPSEAVLVEPLSPLAYLRPGRKAA